METFFPEDLSVYVAVGRHRRSKNLSLWRHNCWQNAWPSPTRVFVLMWHTWNMRAQISVDFQLLLWLKTQTCSAEDNWTSGRSWRHLVLLCSSFLHRLSNHQPSLSKVWRSKRGSLLLEIQADCWALTWAPGPSGTWHDTEQLEVQLSPMKTSRTWMRIFTETQNSIFSWVESGPKKQARAVTNVALFVFHTRPTCVQSRVVFNTQLVEVWHPQLMLL